VNLVAVKKAASIKDLRGAKNTPVEVKSIFAKLSYLNFRSWSIVM